MEFTNADIRSGVRFIGTHGRDTEFTIYDDAPVVNGRVSHRKVHMQVHARMNDGSRLLVNQRAFFDRTNVIELVNTGRWEVLS